MMLAAPAALVLAARQGNSQIAVKEKGGNWCVIGAVNRKILKDELFAITLSLDDEFAEGVQVGRDQGCLGSTLETVAGLMSVRGLSHRAK